MANAGMFLGWKDARQGREPMASELFAETMGFYARLKEKGEIESFEPVLISRHGGDMNGFVLIRGTVEQMDALRHSDDFRAFVIRATYCLDGFGAVETYLGDRLMQMMNEWGAQVDAGG